MTCPEWADAQLSKDLAAFRQRGENQELEYKSQFPSNGNDLTREIASFATSNQGAILVGVSDEGELVGLSEATSATGRDELVKRVGGLCRGAIKPAITPAVKFAIEDEKVVLVLIVPKGSEPVYYSNGKPYLRHLTEARPADPHEVVEFVRDWLSTSSVGNEEDDELGEFYGRLANLLVEVLIYGEELGDREINPWLEMWRTQYSYIADELRSLAATETAYSEQVSDEIELLAKSLDAAANMRLYMGCGPELAKLVTAATQSAREIKEKLIDVHPLSEGSLAGIAESIVTASRKLSNLASRADLMVNSGRVDEFQSEAANMGYDLLRLGYFNVDSLMEELGSTLRIVGRRLHLVETMRIQMDGGRSIQKIVGVVSDCQADLAAISTSLQ